MDGAAVDCANGRLKPAFTAAKKVNDGARAITSSYGLSNHITAVIAISAAGHITPPFSTVSGSAKVLIGEQQ